MTVDELQTALDQFSSHLPVVIEGRLSDPNDVIQIHDIQQALGTDGREEVHLIAADGIRDRG